MSEELNLEPIKELFASMHESEWNMDAATELAEESVPAMIAEIERLRAALGRRGAQEEEQENRSDGDGPALHQPQRETSNVLGLSATTGNTYVGESAVARHHPTDSPSAALRGVGVEAGAHVGAPPASKEIECMTDADWDEIDATEEIARENEARQARENDQARPDGLTPTTHVGDQGQSQHLDRSGRDAADAHGSSDSGRDERDRAGDRSAEMRGVGTPQEKEPLLIPDEVERTIPHGLDVNYAIKALDAAALWEPEKMLELADTLERAPHWAMCEAQYLRGIASRLTRSVPLGTLHQEEKDV